MMPHVDPYGRITGRITHRPLAKCQLTPVIASDEARHYANVASLPCMLPNCDCGGAYGVQVAHSNQLADGKARGKKAPWWMVAALCPTAHVMIDSGIGMTKNQRREAWDLAFKRTNAELFARGLLRPVEQR